MNTISPETVEQIWQQINEASEEELHKMGETMRVEQPFVMTYLLACDENLFDEEERGTLLELGAIIWRIMSAGDTSLRLVRGEELEAAEEANLAKLEDMGDDTEEETAGEVADFFTGYNQMPLLGAVLEALMAGHEDDPEEAPDNVGLTLLHLKTVIDCLDQ